MVEQNTLHVLFNLGEFVSKEQEASKTAYALLAVGATTLTLLAQNSDILL